MWCKYGLPQRITVSTLLCFATLRFHSSQAHLSSVRTSALFFYLCLPSRSSFISISFFLYLYFFHLLCLSPTSFIFIFHFSFIFIFHLFYLCLFHLLFFVFYLCYLCLPPLLLSLSFISFIFYLLSLSLSSFIFVFHPLSLSCTFSLPLITYASFFAAHITLLYLLVLPGGPSPAFSSLTLPTSSASGHTSSLSSPSD